MTCSHKRGDWITEQMYWLCADCWTRLEQRPTRYGLAPQVSGSEYRAPIQEIVWQAEIAEADGVTLSEFIRAMTRRFMQKTRPSLHKTDAYDLSIDILKSLDDRYGDPAYAWDMRAARELVDDELQYWDREPDGNQ